MKRADNNDHFCWKFFLFCGILFALVILIWRYRVKSRHLQSEYYQRSSLSIASVTPALDEIAEQLVTLTDVEQPASEQVAVATEQTSDVPVPESEFASQERDNLSSVDEQEAAAVTETEPLYEAYCVKCRQKRVMNDSKQIVTKNGRNALEGVCPVCGTRLFRFIAR
ncbi:MAG TPA: DUF5679 domain-containing protein [Dictyobacter sp.]|nr:DUF5679 domain-containing protein [Dictyobacter sp.]